MTEPLDRSRRDSTLFQFTTKQLRDFIDPNHLLIRIDEQLDFAKLVEPFTYYLGCSGRPLGANRTGDTGVGPTQIEGAQPGRPAEDAGRDYLSAAQRLPVEPAAQGVGRRQHHPSDLPTLGRVWGAGGHLGGPDRRMPGVGWGELGMAVGGLLYGQSAFWGAPLDETPPTGAKPAARRASWSTQQADP